MLLSFIGSGNVATVLAKRFYKNGFTIHEVYSRTEANAVELCNLVNAKPINNIEQLSKNADVYIICVSDKALVEISPHIYFNNKLIIHTAGSVSIDVLKTSNEYGVLYPVQSLRKVMSDETPIPFLIDGNNETTIQKIEALALAISNKTARGNDEARVKLHVACVFACNFTNFMYLQSANFCKAEHLDFSLIQSLIEETANRLQHYHPSEVFTGPAVRGDMATVNKHLSLLEKYPSQHELYKMISENIIKLKAASGK